MDIFDRLDLAQKKIESATSKANRLLATPEKKIENEPELLSPSSSVHSGHHEKKQIEFLKTMVIPVESKYLVWVPYYRYRTVLFPARLCSDDEAIAEPSIPWPIATDHAVVEIFDQVIYTGISKFLLVEKKKILPFYASSQKEKNVELNEIPKKWNETNFQKMKKVQIND